MADAIYRSITLISGLRPSWGALFIVVLIVLSVITVFYQGKGGVVRQTIGIYLSVTIYYFLPLGSLSSKFEQAKNFPYADLISFLIILLAVWFLLSRTPLILLNKERSTFITTFLMAVLCNGFLLVMITTLLPDAIIREFGPAVRWIFLEEISQLLWAILPIIGFIFLWVNFLVLACKSLIKEKKLGCRSLS